MMRAGSNGKEAGEGADSTVATFNLGITDDIDFGCVRRSMDEVTERGIHPVTAAAPPRADASGVPPSATSAVDTSDRCRTRLRPRPMGRVRVFLICI